MTNNDFFEENCENCGYRTGDDRCGNLQSVYYSRPVVYRDGDEVLQTGWCDRWDGTAGTASLLTKSLED